MAHKAHKIEFIDYSANTLTYLADGKQIDVTGEFEIKNGVLKHTHEFEDGEEMPLHVLIENKIDFENNKSNIEVFGYAERWGVYEIQQGGITINKDACVYGCDTDEEAIDYAFEQIAEAFPLIDEKEVKNHLKIYLSGLIEK